MNLSRDKREPFYTLSNFLKERFGEKVYKIPIAVMFSCPNRDGTKGFGGCTYCDNRTFNATLDKQEIPPISTQVKEGIELMKRRYGANKFIVYFQTFTGTYGTLDFLKTQYEQALIDPSIIGIAIGTRPDAVSPPILDMLGDYARRYHVWIEYGLQSMHDRTLSLINRGHTFQDFKDAVMLTHGRGIFICVHVIIGLPGETREDIIETARTIASLPIDGVKLHHLSISKDTPMEQEYISGNIPVLSEEDYVSLAVSFLEELPPWVVIQRLCGECRKDLLIAPLWKKSKNEIKDAIVKEFRRRESYQGKNYRKEKNYESALF